MIDVRRRVLSPVFIMMTLCVAFTWALSTQAREQAPLVDWTTVGDEMSPLIVRRMVDNQIPGAIFVVVKGSRVLLSAGYGVADIDSGMPVIPGQTRFRLASLSKPLTALAAARLADQGALTLDAGIHSYLQEEMPTTAFPDDITMVQLLTHTAGFDNTDIGDASYSKDGVLTLAQYVGQRMTRQTTRPGARFRYANPGYALAGRVIERLSREPFHEHMASALLVPLEMTTATFGQPAPDETIATGHVLVDGELKSLPYDYTQTAPADALIATADDMARFLLFQLGRKPGIISAEGLASTHGLQFSQTGSWPGMALGWVDERRTGRRMLEHSGGMPGFTSYMAVFPDQDIGIFVALNRRDSGARIGMLIELWDRYLPTVTADEEDGSVFDPARPLAEYAGRYRNSDFPLGDMQKVPGYLGLYDDLVQVEPGPAELLIDGRRYLPVAPDTFRLVGTDLVQRFDFSGARPVLLKGRYAYDYVSWYERPMVIGIFLVGLVVLSVYTGVRGIRRLWLTRGSATVGRPAHLLTDIAGILLLVTLMLYVHVMLLAVFNDGLDYGTPMTGFLMLPVALFSTLALVIALGYHILKLSDRQWRGQPGSLANLCVLLTAMIGMVVGWQLRMFITF